MSVRYGLIGYGAWGGFHAKAIEASPSAQLVAIAASSHSTAQRAKNEHQADVYTDYTELLMRDDIDVVDIVVPNHLHHEVALRALQAGKHILLEKPMALTVEACEELNEEALRKGLTIQIGFELHYSPLWGTVKRMIDEGKLGTLKTASIHLSRFPYRSGAAGWRKDANRVGNWILEEPIHFYDLVRWYFGGQEQPVSVYALGNSREAADEANGLFENISTSILFSKGGFATVNQTLAAYGHYLSGEFVGTNGVLKARWSGASDRIRDPEYRLDYFDGQAHHEVEIGRTPGELFELEHQLAQFTQRIADGNQPDVSGEDGQWAVKLSLAAQDSIVRRQIVALSAT
ncbi:Gfo/Idh/MocA family protein [Paenibacillus allorhizosphaerae]|uniref:Scyllo-inositol 2-dehydrogenase (NAD(+)) n=1 Tax=Paenibacillus allorhizosphaerae TaxID=2849866 RepID=A0ABM8VA31_9BACL|nr:Gfo/Idh/MocA family oxidoreductase [Paenibacillus allorhizosphaerae]CAG7615263.1 scyllo-inositol 2-dehydrogenase (NAD(+)) [Paenibacillus allorhizosphaerae]